MAIDITLSPSQRAARAEAVAHLERGPLAAVAARAGTGRTSILRSVAAELGAPVVTIADVLDASAAKHPLRVEESLLESILRPLATHSLVVVDDAHLIGEIFERCHFSARPSLLELVSDALLAALERGDKRVLLGVRKHAPARLHPRCLYSTMGRFTAEDLRFLLDELLGERAARVDEHRVHRFVPRLDGHQLRFVARRLALDGRPTTEEFLEFLERHALASNVDTGAVEQVRFEDLHGVDDVKKSLDVDVIIPLENPELSERLRLEAKRGVLLYGPPGTGKTSIGRALAHRLRSKFFLIDGTIISGTRDFFQRIHHIFEAAKENAPSVLFVDDSDLLFEDSDETGLYRYLLTMLDGLESDGPSRVTVVLTAMNIGSMPPALVRSGRVELWLKLDVPNVAARTAILGDRLARCAEPIRGADAAALAERCEGLTGADLKRIVGDASNLHGYDVAREIPSRDATTYFTEALDRLERGRAQMAAAPTVTAAHTAKANRRGLYAARAALNAAEEES